MSFEDIKIEKKEKQSDNVFTIGIDKKSLGKERDNIAKEGLHVLDTILKLPEKITLPKETTIIVGPNGSGKSTLLGLFWLMGQIVSLKESDISLEQARDEVLKFTGMAKTEVKKLGLAPLIVKHTTLIEGINNVGIVKIHKIPEEAGRAWLRQEEEEMGGWDMDTETGKAEFIKGKAAQKILGSTQQIIDKRMQMELEEDFIGDIDQKKRRVILLDEPTGSSDLNRVLGYLKELDNLNNKHGKIANFIIATNDALFALHRNIPRIDLGHPERGVHRLKDYPLNDKVLRDLRDMGYAPIEK